jgi:hypothetical protein
MKKLMSYDRYPHGKRKAHMEVEIKCTDCATTICQYDKEGYGPIGKIIFKSILGNSEIKDKKELECQKCEKLLGKKVTAFENKEKVEFFKMYPGVIFYKVLQKGRK